MAPVAITKIPLLAKPKTQSIKAQFNAVGNGPLAKNNASYGTFFARAITQAANPPKKGTNQNISYYLVSVRAKSSETHLLRE